MMLSVLLAVTACKKEKEEEHPIVEETIVEEPIEMIEFGFNLNDYVVLNDTVRSGDSFGKILLENNVDYPTIANISTTVKDTFDVRRINVGKPFTLLKSKDTSETAQVFIYQHNRVDYTVVDFRDSIVQAYKESKPITIVKKEASGEIVSSLSEAIESQNLSYTMVNDLSDIYAWTIDFFRLQKGDKFKVIYNQRYLNDSINVGIENIEAAYFEHNGKPFYAFEFKTDSIKGIIDYFDEEAKNLRRAFLKAPVQFSRISSRYNLRRKIRLYGRVKPHRGTDFAAPVGTEIMATANGTVVKASYTRGNGNYVKIKHNSTYSTQYLHMKKRKVRVGDHVKQGDVIGWVGMTGYTSGPHVCYRFWKNGKQVDPFRQKLPDADPIDEELKEKFLDYIIPIKQQLDSIPFQEIAPPEDNPEPLITSIN